MLLIKTACQYVYKCFTGKENDFAYERVLHVTASTNFKNIVKVNTKTMKKDSICESFQMTKHTKPFSVFVFFRLHFIPNEI